MQQKIDPRKVRTRQMLRDALIALILEKGYDAITLQAITDKAGLRRATFYLHYKDKEELLFTILKDTFDELVSEIDKLQVGVDISAAQLAIYQVIFKHAQENADLYLSILTGRGASTITRYIREYLSHSFLEEMCFRNPDLELTMPMNVLANFNATIELNMAIWWLEQEMPYSPEQMAEMCTKLTLNGLQSAFKPITAQMPT
ncbi:MAG: TetR/AcrR family transcriptional regulator [Chloroflexota bacterium]